ncbi:metal ABC transporter permease [Candidatus Uhrbacteria bacterium]|nr:metal ABC transporter permease [Candidatus Uhrbacteria bacterium]
MFTIFSYDFMIRAFVAGILLAFVAPTIGIFFVVRRYSAMADALAHVSLAGVAGGLLLGISPVWSALGACVLAVLGIERIREQRTLASDAVVVLFLFGGLALGVVMIGLRPAGGINVASYLFGSILTVTRDAVVQTAYLSAATLAVVAVFWRSLFAVSLDEDVARAGGFPVRFLNRVVAVLGAATIAISIHVVGVLLIGALMVIPVLAAMQFHVGFRATWRISVALSLLSVVGGLIISFYANLASGATIVLCAIAGFLLALGISKMIPSASSVSVGEREVV